MSHPVRAAAEAIQPWLVETRRTIHMNPELGYEERETSRLVAEALEGFGLEVRRGVAETGVVGLLRTGRPGPTLGIRADMDALPIEEANDLPYKSRQAGKMHACGHDAHTTMLLGAARVLGEHPDLLDGRGGNVKFLFQPAEEGKAGGRRMVEAGVLDDDPRVDLVIASHVFPDLDAGTIGTRSGSVLAASDKFRIVLKGRGSHAAYPHNSRDPILGAGHLITALQGVVSRNVEPFAAAVVSVTRIHAGTAFNIIPDEVTLEGTMRTHDDDVREMVKGRIEETVQGVAAAFGLQGTFDFMAGYPVLKNHPSATSLVEAAGRAVLGEANVQRMPLSMGGEDFAYMARERPGSLFRVGIRNEAKGIVHGLHSNRFNVDEDVLCLGVSVFVEAAREFLANSGSYQP